MLFILNIVRRLIREFYIKRLIRRGLKLGANFQMEKGCNIDANFPWLIEIGSNVTLASDVYLVAHDGSTQKVCGYSKVGKIVIGNNVFIGTKSIIMPGLEIGDNVIIGAGSVVSKSIPANKVVAGVPAREIYDLEKLKEKVNIQMNQVPVYGVDYTLGGNIKEEKKAQMNEELTPNMTGFIV